jgi:hypothetical protein
MSYTRLEAHEEDRPHGQTHQGQALWIAGLTKAASVIVWAVINAALLFTEQLAELLAPLLLLAGAVWWAIPRALDTITLEGPANDVLQTIRGHVPHEIVLGGDYYTAGALIWNGILCIAVVAICRTLSTLLATLLLDRR